MTCTLHLLFSALLQHTVALPLGPRWSAKDIPASHHHSSPAQVFSEAPYTPRPTPPLHPLTRES